jgi:hypothetical protein
MTINNVILSDKNKTKWATIYNTVPKMKQTTHTQHNKSKPSTIIELKQALTFLHFISLITTAIIYMSHLERYQARAVIMSFGTFVLAFCIPPIGMINPEDAPDAARGALGWMPERGDLNESKDTLAQEEEEKKSSSGKGKKKGKKGSKKND